MGIEGVHFVFDYYHSKDHSAWVACAVRGGRLGELEEFESVEPEERNQAYWQNRCLDVLQQKKVRTVFSARGKDSMKDVFLGFLLHYSEGEGSDFFHFDFVNPADYADRFRERGIELQEFSRDGQ